MKRLTALILLVLLLGGLLPTVSLAQAETATSAVSVTPVEQLVDADGNVIFNDSAVESAVRMDLGIPEGPVTKKQIAGVGSEKYGGIGIDGTGAPIDLSVLQLCTKLRNLYLFDVQAKDWGALSACAGLESISFQSMKLTNLDFLAGLKKLAMIWLDNTTCDDLTAVKLMPRLFYFSSTEPIADITPLTECKKLNNILLAGPTDEQLAALLEARGKKILYLSLKDCALSDENIARLKTYKIFNYELKNVTYNTALSLWDGMKSVQYASLENMDAAAIQGIDTLKRLKSLSCVNMKNMTDLSAVFALPTLTELTLGGETLPALQGIDQLKKLKSFTLTDTATPPDLSPVYALTKLSRLNFYNVTLSSLAGIETMQGLKEIDWYNVTGVKDYAPLLQLKKLKNIYTDNAEQFPEGLPVF